MRTSLLWIGAATLCVASSLAVVAPGPSRGARVVRPDEHTRHVAAPVTLRVPVGPVQDAERSESPETTAPGSDGTPDAGR